MEIVPLFLPRQQPNIRFLFPMVLTRYFLMINFDMMVYMGSTTVPSALQFCKMFTNYPPSVRAAKIAHNSLPKAKLYNAKFSYNISQGRHSHKASFNCNGAMRTARMAVACVADDSGPREEHRALETVLKLYEAIKNKNVYEISDVIAEECLCVSNFVSAFQPFLGKKQVLAFFSSLMKCLGNNIEFVVQPTLDDGMVVGVNWKLEWNKVPLPLGKGFSVYMCHVYQGKVMIKNVEIFLEPLLHIEPLRLKMISLVMTAMEKLTPQALFKSKERKALAILFIVLILAAIVIIFKYSIPTLVVYRPSWPRRAAG